MREIHQQSVGNALVNDLRKRGEVENAKADSVLGGAAPIIEDVRDDMITVVFRIVRESRDSLSTERVTIEYNDGYQIRLHPAPDIQTHPWKWQMDSIGIQSKSKGGDIDPTGVCRVGELEANAYVFRAEIKRTLRDFMKAKTQTKISRQ